MFYDIVSTLVSRMRRVSFGVMTIITLLVCLKILRYTIVWFLTLGSLVLRFVNQFG